MSIIKAAQTGARVGEIFGPEGEVIGAGALAAAAIAAQIANEYRHDSSSSESKERSPLLPINPRDIQRSRPGIFQIPRTTMTQSGGQVVSSSGNAPAIPSSSREGLRQRARPRPIVVPIEPYPANSAGYNPDEQQDIAQGAIERARQTSVESSVRGNLTSMIRQGRRPLAASTIATAALAPIVTAPSATASTVNVEPPRQQPPESQYPTNSEDYNPEISNTAPPLLGYTHAPPRAGVLPRLPHQAVSISQPHFAAPPQVNRSFVGNYQFPLGAYQYADYNKFTFNNTLRSLS